MGIANLTRYDMEAYTSCIPINAEMVPYEHGDWVKFEEAMEASSNSLQQLKAEILPMIKEAVSDLKHDESASFIRPYYSRAMSNLSIVEAKLSAV